MTASANKLTLGIDEAGRGPAIGPLVMAAVLLDTKSARSLSRKGLTDSKAYGAGAAAIAKREQLEQDILQTCSWSTVRIIAVATLDVRVFRGELNQLERETALAMIEESPTADRIVADGKTLFGPLACQLANLEALDGAEAKHAAVAAASVLAKAKRDRLFAEFAASVAPEFGPLGGGGYVNAKTREFLVQFAKRYRTLPSEARLSWPHPYVGKLCDLEQLRRQRYPEAQQQQRQLTLL